MAISSQIRVPVLTLWFESSIPIFVIFMSILDELDMAGSDYDVLVCAESKVSHWCHLSEHGIPGVGCPQQKLRNFTPGTQGMALYVRAGFCSFRQSKLE